MNDLVLLIALLGGPKHGYSLKQSAGLIFGQAAQHNNVIYPLLKMFLQNGWVQQSIAPGERGQERKEYSITLAGRDHLLQRLEEFDQERAMEDESFLLRVSMFSLLSKEAQAKILNLRKEHLQSRMANLRRLRDNPAVGLYPRLVLDHVIHLTENELLWIGDLENLSPDQETKPYEA